MTNHVFETGSEATPPVLSRQNAVERTNRFREFRNPHRITDPGLVRKVRRANGILKRIFDFAGAACLLLALGPAFLTIALAIKFSDNGPVFYKHRRLGRQARSFYCLKFRTMRVDAQAQLQLILSTDPAAAEEWRTTQKLRSDPRVTKLGAFLRKSSLDELPQLINVLRGEMSLVGPRPITPAELERYGSLRRYYLLVRPGITGLWQVSGRSSTSYASRIRFDREYLERWTWLEELRILLMTLPAVLRTTDSC